MNKKQKALIFLIAVSTILFTSTTAIGNNVSNNLKVQNTDPIRIIIDTDRVEDGYTWIIDDGGYYGGCTLTSIPKIHVVIWEYITEADIDLNFVINGGGGCSWKIKEPGGSWVSSFTDTLTAPLGVSGSRYEMRVCNLPKRYDDKDTVYGTITIEATGSTYGNEFEPITTVINLEVTPDRRDSWSITRTNSAFLSMLQERAPRLSALFDFLLMSQ